MAAPLAHRIRAWLFEDAWPLWGGVGVDRSLGGFHEALDLAGRPAGLGYKRTRVTCRQVYVFAHAAELGWPPGAALCDHGYAFLKRSQLGTGAWARQLTPAGDVLDPTIDLYDHAFVLHALAWRLRLTADREPLALAHGLVDFLERDLRAGPGLGFTHEQAPGGWRYQNPHMHLLEASLAMAEASRAARFLDLARELVGLFQRVFFDGRTLGEYFEANLAARAAGPMGQIVEPGHMFEWAWILAQYQRLSGERMGDAICALTDFAEAHGVHKVTGVTFNAVTPEGVVSDGGSRTWPNTERMKGWLARHEIAGGVRPAAADAAASLLLDRYLAVSPAGSWMDSFDAEGRPAAANAPTSTLYHVALSFAEYLRLAPNEAA